MERIYLKIQTLPREVDLTVGSVQFEMYKNTYLESKQIMSDDDIISNYYKDAGKSPVFGRIYSVTVGFVNGGQLRCKHLYGEEHLVYKELFSLINTNFKNSNLIAWNFDFISGFLGLPLYNTGLQSELPAVLKELRDAKPWNRKTTIDLFGIVNPGWSKISLMNTLQSFGIGVENLLRANQLFKEYKKENLGALFASAKDSILGIVNAHRKIEGLDFIEDVNFDVVEVTPKPKKTVSLLDHIGAKGDISMKEAELLVDFVKGNSLNINHVVDTVKAAVSQNTNKPDEHSVVQYIKDELRGKADMTGLEDVLEKGNLTKKIADRIIKDNADAKKKDNKALVTNLEKFLIDKDKMKQKTASEAFKFVKSKLL